MRLVFMGTPDFAVPSFSRLLEHGYNVCAAVTVPDKPAGRGLHSLSSPVKRFALGHGIPLLVPRDLRDSGFINDLKKLDADCGVVVAFRILPPEVYSIPRAGMFNLHASLLPKYRGAAPINWAIINGEKETGVTTFFLREKVDTGDIILKKRLPIGPDETAGELHDRLADAGADAVLETLRIIEGGTISRCPQDDTLATPAPKIFTEHCRIDWARQAPEVHNFIRGLSPRPGAFTFFKGKTLKIFRSVRADGPIPGNPGAVFDADGRLVVGTGNGAVEILELQAEGRKRLGAAEFLRGTAIHTGDMLGE